MSRWRWLWLALVWAWLAWWLWSLHASAGEPSHAPNPAQMQQQYIGDISQTVKEQDIPRGALIKELVLDLLDEIGYVKALVWLAALPVCAVLGVVWGAVKVFKR